jgi:WD40 repeat protein
VARDCSKKKVSRFRFAGEVGEVDMRKKICGACVIATVLAMALAACAWGNARRPAQGFEIGPNQWINSVAFSGDGRSILAEGFTKPGSLTISSWDIATGRKLHAFSAKESIVDIDGGPFSPDRRTLATIKNDVGYTQHTLILLWDVATGKQLRRLEGHIDNINDVEFSSDGRMLVSGSKDQTVRLWDFATGKQLKMMQDTNGVASAVAVSSDGHTLATAGDNSPSGESEVGDTVNTIELWDSTSGQITQTLSRQKYWTSSLAFSPDGHTLASACWDDTVTLWDVATGKALRSISGLADLPTELAFSPDGHTLAISNGDDTVQLRDVATGQLLQTLKGHTDQVLSIAFSADGKTIATGAYDNTIKLWDPASGKLLKSFGVPNPPDDNTGSAGAKQ